MICTRILDTKRRSWLPDFQWVLAHDSPEAGIVYFPNPTESNWPRQWFRCKP